ncbi:hypothetical protein PsYK624_125490 [Phanerochaete sordida]|uniref:DUF6533 domain-containing protein n=1 Tax=Phanerochaete sordida TaxID=48140 RepID=A0A9P3LJ59_9APHY|nr:hypothetical protein PsYK624_125490 [Phanerochaete sordida]
MADSTEETRLAFEAFLASDYTACALTSLVCYEYIITFCQEIDCVWKRPLNATSLLLLSTRWVMVVSQLLWHPVSSDSQCQLWAYVNYTLILVTWAQIALFSGLCIPIATNSFALSRIQAVYEGSPIGNCADVVNVSDSMNTISAYDRALLPGIAMTRSFAVLYLTRSSVIAADVLVLVLTWIKTFVHWRQLRQIGIKHSISALLLRDGIYTSLSTVSICT